MTSVNVTEFRRNLPTYLAIASSGRKVRVIRRGRVVALLVPPVDVRTKAKKALQGLRGRARLGDVESPVGDAWEADSASP